MKNIKTCTKNEVIYSMNLYKKYTLRKDLTENQLIKYGFHNGKNYHEYIYKDILQLIIIIDVETHEWWYQVYNTSTDTFYPAYYNRTYGVDLMILEVDDNIEKIMKKLVRANIFKKKNKKGKKK